MTITVGLHDIPFFKGIPKDILHKMTDGFSVRAYKSGETIIECGSTVEAIFLVIDGKVDVYTSDKEAVITTLSFGATIGEISLFVNKHVASAHVVAAAGDAHLLTMPKNLIDSNILTDPTSASYFYRGMCGLLAERLCGTNDSIAAKIRELKQNLRSIMDDSHLLDNIKNTQSNLEHLGNTVFESLASISNLLETHDSIDKETAKIMDQAKDSVEKILLKDLQNVDRIAQKIGLTIQYLENIERTINNQQLADIRGDVHLFDKQNP